MIICRLLSLHIIQLTRDISQHRLLLLDSSKKATIAAEEAEAQLAAAMAAHEADREAVRLFAEPTPLTCTARDLCVT